MGQTHPQYEALLRQNFDRDEVWRVYADWLEEAGESLEAQLIRLALSPQTPLRVRSYGDETEHTFEDSVELQALIARHFRHWFGLSSDFHLGVDWSHGFARCARLESETPIESCAAVFAHPRMRFLRSFTVEGRGTSASMDGVWLAPTLEHLGWAAARSGATAPLRGHSLPALTSLSLSYAAEPSPADLEALGHLEAPALADFSLEARGVREARLLSAVLAAAWFEGVASARLAVTSGEGLEVVGVARPVLARKGDRLSLALPPHRIATDRERVLRLLPRARVVPLTPVPVSDDSGPQPRVCTAPVHAPPNFRSLPPWGTKHGEGIAGSGIAFADPAAPRYLDLVHCAHCGSAETRLLFHHRDRVELNSFESQTLEDWEFECLDCRRFTVCRRSSIH